jgi:hypothetical protein
MPTAFFRLKAEIDLPDENELIEADVMLRQED